MNSPIQQLDLQYDSVSGIFSSLHDGNNNFNRQRFYEHITDQMIADRDVLDIGCGDGTDMYYYQSRGGKVTGIDSSIELLTLAQQKVDQKSLHLGNMESLPFAENSFDTALSKYALQTSTELDTIYQEVFRVLRPGGIFMFLVTHPTRFFMEQRIATRDYFTKEILALPLFHGAMTVYEPSKTMMEYISPVFLGHFDILSFDEAADPYSAELVDGAQYPGFAIIKCQSRKQ